MRKISVSFLKSIYPPFTAIKKIGMTDANYVHVDVMDGYFVKEKNYTPSELKELLKDSNTPLDVHLMVKNPMKWIPIFASLRTDFISIHPETTKEPEKVLLEIQKTGIRSGVVLKPRTKVSSIINLIPYTDMFLIMSVNPGKGGQEFMTKVLPKIDELKKYQRDHNFVISIDGGINEENASLIDTDIIVVGSFVAMNEDFQEQINKLKITRYPYSGKCIIE